MDAILTSCPFCAIPPQSHVASSRHAFAIRDAFPVAVSHTLVIPRRHVQSLFSLDVEEQADLWMLVARVRGELMKTLEPDGFTIGTNDGIAAGQTVAHAHAHVIPRVIGDSSDPRGGIRWVLPERAAYWDRTDDRSAPDGRDPGDPSSEKGSP